MKTRVGAVPYLNALPLYQSLLTQGDPDLTLIFDIPSKLSQDLEGGLLQAALCPAIQVCFGDYELLPSHGVISKGKVGSVHLYSIKDPKDWKTVSCDPASISSRTLVDVLCQYHFKNKATLVPEDRDVCDAYFLIGDQDLSHQPLEGVQSWDLGAQWQELTGLPFLYAAWIVRPTIPERIKSLLDESLISFPHDHLAEMIENFSQRLSLKKNVIDDYLKNNIYYRIDDEVMAGFSQFVRYAYELSILKNKRFRIAQLL